MISVKHIKRYLAHLKPYINAVKAFDASKELNDEQNSTVVGLQTQQGQKEESEGLQFAYKPLCAAYMSVYGLGTTNLNSKIHDGWSIYQIAQRGADIEPETSSKVFHLNLNESNKTDIGPDELFLILNRRDHLVGIHIDGQMVPCDQFHVHLKFNEVDIVLRGDELNQLIDYKYLTKNGKDADTAFASYIRKNAVQINQLVGYLFNKPIILPKVKVPKPPKPPKAPKPQKPSKPYMKAPPAYPMPVQNPLNYQYPPPPNMPGIPGIPGIPRQQFAAVPPPPPPNYPFQQRNPTPNSFLHQQHMRSQMSQMSQMSKNNAKVYKQNPVYNNNTQQRQYGNPEAHEGGGLA